MTSNSNNENQNIGTSLSQYLKLWKLFLPIGVLFVLGAYIISKVQKPVYLTETKVQILDDETPFEFALNNSPFQNNLKLENEVQLLQSKRLLRRVIDSLNLEVRYFITSRTGKIEIWNPSTKIIPLDKDIRETITFEVEQSRKSFKIYNANQEIILGQNDKTFVMEGRQFQIMTQEKGLDLLGQTITIETDSEINALNWLVENLKVSTTGDNSDIINVSLKTENIAKSKAILNCLIRVFNDDVLADKKLVLANTIKFIDSRLQLLSKEVINVDVYKQNYKEKESLSFLETDVNNYIQKSSSSEDLVFNVKTQIELAKLLYATCSKNESKILPENLGLENLEINNLIHSYNAIQLQRDKLLINAGDNHPTIKNITDQLGTLQSKIINAVQLYIDQLTMRLAQYKDNSKIQHNKVYRIPENERKLRDIERDQKTKEDLYLLLLQKREETLIAQAAVSPSIKMIDYAENFPYPVSPKPKIYLLSGFLLALLFPIIFVKLSNLFDTKIKNLEDLKYNLSVPVIGSIPKFDGNEKFDSSTQNSLIAELFKILKTNIDFLITNRTLGEGAVIFVTSSISGEGKTYTAKNLSNAFASYQKKTLLIGADLRRPKLTEELGLEYNGKGLSNFLSSIDISLDSVLAKGKTSFENLDIIFSGHIPPNPSNLLSNGRFAKLMQEAKQRYDYIIVDCAPTIYVNDTLLISKYADLTIYLLRCKYTDKAMVSHSDDLAGSQKIKNMNYVLNYAEKINGIKYDYNYYVGSNTTLGKNKKWIMILRKLLLKKT